METYQAGYHFSLGIIIMESIQTLK